MKITKLILVSIFILPTLLYANNKSINSTKICYVYDSNQKYIEMDFTFNQGTMQITLTNIIEYYLESAKPTGFKRSTVPILTFTNGRYANENDSEYSYGDIGNAFLLFPINSESASHIIVKGDSDLTVWGPLSMLGSTKTCRDVKEYQKDMKPISEY